MVFESQSKTICLMNQGQRGTSIFLTPNPGRARGDRKLLDGGRLFETADTFPPALEIEVAVAPSQPRAPGQPGRVARVAVSFGKATIAKPKTGRACSDPKSCEINVVVAREIGAPAGAKPLMWRLLTTLPVETAEDALEVVRLYRLRWRIDIDQSWRLSDSRMEDRVGTGRRQAAPGKRRRSSGFEVGYGGGVGRDELRVHAADLDRAAA